MFKYMLFKHSEGFAKIFVHYLFFDMGQVKLSLDKYPMAIYLSLGKYQLLLFPHHRLGDCWFETHWRHCVVSLSKTLGHQISTGSTQEIA